jgi:hypothetical protein
MFRGRTWSNGKSSTSSNILASRPNETFVSRAHRANKWVPAFGNKRCGLQTWSMMPVSA